MTTRKRPKEEFKRKGILVAGMHRSGTSAFTRVLNLLGADLPKNLMPEVEGNNERGFWESRDTMALNDNILASVNQDWHTPYKFPRSWINTENSENFKSQAYEFLSNNFENSKLFVIKDPRICRFLPFWIEVLTRFNAKPHIAIPIRHPLEVARSLNRRDEFSLPYGLLLWLRNCLDAEYDSRGFPRAFVSYESFLADWRPAIKRVSAQLNLTVMSDSFSLANQVDTFLSPQLRHNEASLKDLAGREDIAEWIEEAYGALLELSDGNSNAKLPQKRLDRIREALDIAELAFAPLLSEQKFRMSDMEVQGEELAAQVHLQTTSLTVERDQAKADLFARGEQLEHLHGEMGQQTEHVAALNTERDHIHAQVAERDQRIEAQQAQVAERDQRIEAQQAQVAERDQRIEAQQAEATRRIEELDDLNTERDQIHTKVAERDQRIEAQQAEAIRRIEELAQLNTERDRIHALVAERDQRIEAQQAEAILRTGEVSALATEQHHLETVIKEQQRHVRHLEYYLQTIRQSLFWWLIWPFWKGGQFVNATAKAFRRRRHRFEVEPFQNVQPTSGTGKFAWEALESDPAFLLVPMTMKPVSGLVRLRMRLLTDRPPSASKLYFDTGLGFSEVEVAWLRPPERDWIDAVLKVPRLTQSIRFDPTENSGLFTIEAVTLTEISLLEASLRIGLGVLRRAHRHGRTWRSLVAQALPLLVHGGLRGHLKKAYTGRRNVHALPDAGAGFPPPEHYDSEAIHGEIRSAIRTIAFYLPQFHPIPENDAWWGKGFTEWRNVTRGTPQFEGHDQPRRPGELGYYDLRVPEIQEQQAELARQYGIHGFCFHFYWFDGKTLLEHPLTQFAENEAIDFPFCINWANENWSRRWDGLDQDILIAQNHSPEDDIAFIEHISKYLKNPSYIRIDGKPLLSVYRPSLLPDPAATGQRWREWCRENGVGEIYLALTHSFEHVDPMSIGFDAAIEFAPNTFPLKNITQEFETTNPNYQGNILDFRSAIDIAKNFKTPKYKKFRGVCPDWDNTARRQETGTVLAHATPAVYQEWLKTVCQYTFKQFEGDERLVFINAWNEWAEGAYLEPDEKRGFEYLESTAQVLSAFPGDRGDSAGRWTILFVSHDACRAGAQAVLLDSLVWLRKYTAINPKVLCLEGGEWLHRFQALAPAMVLDELEQAGLTEQVILNRVREFCGGTPQLIYGNSVASGRSYGLLHQLNAPILTHFHELELSIQRYAGPWIGDVLRHSAHMIACSEAVRDNLVQRHKMDAARISTVHSSIQPSAVAESLNAKAKGDRRRMLGLHEDEFLLVGCGLGMPFRKGADLFLEVVRELRSRGVDNFHCYWVGGFDPDEVDEQHGQWGQHLNTAKQEGLLQHVTFLGLQENPKDYFQAADLFLLTSREDPFALVALEAAACCVPILCFAESGGIPEFVGDDAGRVVPFENAPAMAEQVAVLQQDRDMLTKLGARAREKVLTLHTTDQMAPDLLAVCRQVADQAPVVSVIVPNFNHARYLPRRLESIFTQTFRDIEVILLDDASTDDSLEMLRHYGDRIDVRIVPNGENSGSAFVQWLKGLDLARGEFIWIAESDDACEPNFLECLLPAFADPNVKLAYADSSVIDENDRVTGDYLETDYLASLSTTKWRRSYTVSANREINEALGVKNTILSASAMVFRRFEIGASLRRDLEGMRLAGDWHLIVHAIRAGKVHFRAEKLNYHRRHSESVIGKMMSDGKVREFYREFAMVQNAIAANYDLAPDLAAKCEQYHRQQWESFFPGRPFEEMGGYYSQETELLGAKAEKSDVNETSELNVLNH